MKPAFLALAFSAALLAQGKPDFNGTWRLNRNESRYPNPITTPVKLLKIVELKADRLRYVIERDIKGDGNVERNEINLTIGDDSTGAAFSARWEGSTLVVTLGGQGGINQIEHWQLDVGGKRLKDQTVIRRPDGTETNILRVYDKD